MLHNPSVYELCIVLIIEDIKRDPICLLLVGKGMNISQFLLMKNEKRMISFLFILLAHNLQIITARSGKCYILECDINREGILTCS